MISKRLAAAVVGVPALVFAAVAAAPAAHAATGGTPVQCDTVGNTNDPAIVTLLGLLGVVLPGATDVGLNCTPTVRGQTPNFCVTDFYLNGLIDLGYLPSNGAC
jgi:hypothetical protein